MIMGHLTPHALKPDPVAIPFCDLLGLRQQEPRFSQNEPRPSVLGVVAAVCLAKAFSYFNATVIAF
jgi:hypothetical protein